MKINWKVLVASVLIVGAVIWSFNAVRVRSYSGANLNFPVGTGTVTVTNPSGDPVAAQLIGTGSRTFTVASTTAGLAGSSTRDGSGTPIKQIFDIAPPAGVSEFTVTRGTDVNFVAATTSRLQANVQPMNEADSRTTIIVAAVVILGALFFISRTTHHSWLNIIRRKQLGVLPLKPVIASADEVNRGRDGRMYSDYGTKE